MVTLIVQLKPEIADILHKGQKNPGQSHTFSTWLKRLGFVLIPLHPGTIDQLLQTYFTIEVPDHVTANRALHALQQEQGVEAVYIKPQDALP